MTKTLAFLVLALAALPAVAQPHQGAAHAHGQPSPYAGEQSREIKALSAREQQAWLEGQGQGLARAAELNGYPGPMHVLELASELGLTPAQSGASRELMARHKAQVRDLGARLVDAERQLDLAFREQRIDRSEVERLTGLIARLQGEIRAAHLNTHLEQAQLLETAQIAAYNRLRGYSR